MAKRSSVALNATLREGDRGLPPDLQRIWQAQMDGQTLGFDLAMKDLGKVKREFEAAISFGDFSRVHSLVVRFDGPPAVLVAAPLTPEFDFSGNRLQDLTDVDRPMEALTYTLIGSGDGGGAAVFAWMGESEVAERFCASITTERSAREPRSSLQARSSLTLGHVPARLRRCVSH